MQQEINQTTDKIQASINDVQETVSVFESKIARAKRQGNGSEQIWVETSKPIIDFYNPNGLGPTPFFSYNGVFVCETGRTQECVDILQRDLNQALHGSNKGQTS